MGYQLQNLSIIVIKLGAVRYGPCQETILSGLSEDLSVGGRYLKTNVPLDLNETLMVSFSLRDQEQEKVVNCKASIAWTNSDMNPRKPDFPLVQACNL